MTAPDPRPAAPQMPPTSANGPSASQVSGTASQAPHDPDVPRFGDAVDRPWRLWGWPLAVVAYAIPMGIAHTAWLAPQAMLAPLFGPWARVLRRQDPWIWKPAVTPVVIALTVLGPALFAWAWRAKATGPRVAFGLWWAVWVFLLLGVLGYEAQ